MSVKKINPRNSFYCLFYASANMTCKNLSSEFKRKHFFANQTIVPVVKRYRKNFSPKIFGHREKSFLLRVSRLRKKMHFFRRFVNRNVIQSSWFSRPIDTVSKT